MTQNRPHTKILLRKNIFIFAAATSFVILAVGTLIQKETRGDSALLNYAGKENGVMYATLQSAHGLKELQGMGKDFNLPAEETLSPPYTLSSSLYESDTDTKDFVFNISKDRKTVSVLVDGFSPEDTVTLALNGTSVSKDIPMDWSGRMELTSDFASDDAVDACVEIGKGRVALCHHIAKASGT